jgi:zinc dependent phospholipase C
MRAGRRGSRQFCCIYRLVVVALALMLTWPRPAPAYAVMAHEAIIDAVWETHLKPLLKLKFPEATEEQLSGAQAYAYGGAVIQDLGYYPHGSHLFSELTHYVRSGDFILAMLRDAQEVNEYAFALGALSHYAADNDGHRLATNKAVPILYPNLGKKYGDVVSYEQDPLAHIKTEFGFDVLEVAKERYAPDSYHDFIGFEVSKKLVEEAFCETYGLELNEVLEDEDRAFESYRRAVSKLIPKATRIAWALKKDDIQNDVPTMTKRRFLYNLSRASYEKDWGKNYVKPTPGEHFLASLWRLLPKWGPLKVLTFRTPTPATEAMFEQSFNATLDRYRALIREHGRGTLNLPNNNFDVGRATGPGVYFKNDEAHARLLAELAKKNFKSAPAEIREELLSFYANPDADYATRRNKREWARLQADLSGLKAVSAPATAVKAAD